MSAVCFSWRRGEMCCRDTRASRDPEYSSVFLPWGPTPSPLLGLLWPWNWIAGQLHRGVGIQSINVCFLLVGLLAPLNNFLILIYWFNFWLAMVIVIKSIYPRKTGYLGNSLMLTHCTWILEPLSICPNRLQQTSKWDQASHKYLSPPFLSWDGRSRKICVMSPLIVNLRNQVNDFH